MSAVRAKLALPSVRGLDWRVVNAGQSTDRLIAQLAAKQFGVVARKQLLELGISPPAIAWRLKQGRLHPIHRGVYLVGHTVAPVKAAEMAAVLACGADSLVSHRSAAFLWGAIAAAPEIVEVTLLRSSGIDRPGIAVHHTSAIDRVDIRMLEGIPLTSPARTLLDLGSVLGPSALERAVAQAEARRLARRSDLLAILHRQGRRPGAGPLRALLEREEGPALTRSKAEERLLSLIRAADLPRAKTNVRIGAHEVDFAWMNQRLVVEVDGFQFHSSRRAFERDRRRDAELARRGYRVIRVTWRQLLGEPAAIVARIAAALAPASG